MVLICRSPHKLSRGNSCLFVSYGYDTNAILFEPLKIRQSREITTAYKKCVNKLAKKLLSSKIYTMDNKCSTDLKLAIIKTKELINSFPHISIEETELKK